MNNLGERILKLREKRGLSQDELASAVGVSQTAIAKIEKNGKTRFTLKLAKALDTTVEWLEEGKGISPFDEHHKIPEAHCPILPWGKVMDWLSGNRDEAVAEMQGTIPSFNASHNSYALRIESESMVNNNGAQRTFLPGTIVIVDPQVNPKNKSFVVISRDGKEPTLRQYIKEGGYIRITPLDPNFDSFYLVETDKILGVVVAHIDLMS